MALACEECMKGAPYIFCCKKENVENMNFVEVVLIENH